MKKILFVLASAAFVASCNKLAENEYIVEGKIDPSFNGKMVFLQKLGGMMGPTAIDTVKVEDGKFIFKDTVSAPSLHIISFEGKQMGDVINFILEPGEIDIEVDKDSLFKSKMGGTYNNEILYKYSKEAIAERKQQQKNAEAFMAQHQTEIQQAQVTRDTAALNKLNRLFISQNSSVKDKPVKFIKDNPKAFINLFLIRDLMSKGILKQSEAKSIFDGLDKEVKDTKEGKDLNEILNPKKEANTDTAQANAATATVGQPAPQFSAPSPEGKPISLKESMGKVTVIDFWASWCKPCRAENPNVVAMYNELHSKGLNIIGVSLDKDANLWKGAIAADKLTWNHVSNLKFWEEPIAKMYGVNSIPATFILDAKGNIVAKDLRGEALKAKVEELLNAK